MSYIFISYCRENQETVTNLAQDIVSMGHKVWVDRELAGGRAWWDQILAVIRDCDVFLFALAPGSLDSPACKREYQYAASLGKPLLPVLIADGVSINLPPELSKIQHVDYRHQGKQEAIAVLKALTGLPQPPPLPDPLPEPPPPPLSYLGGLMEQIDASNLLTFEEQAALVVKLKDQFSHGEYREEVRKLLEKFKKRDDLYARIANEIDALLAPPAEVGLNKEPLPDQTAAFATPNQIELESPPKVEETSPQSVTRRGTDPHRKWQFAIVALVLGFFLSVPLASFWTDSGLGFIISLPIVSIVIWVLIFLTQDLLGSKPKTS
jgi:hypothetical protein